MRHYLLFLPSLLFGVLGGVWLLYRPLPFDTQAGILPTLGVAVMLTLGLLGGAWLLEKLLPSFRYASKMLERTLFSLPMSMPLAVLLAAATSVSEEVFFRGALLPLLGVWGQAFVFGLLHPAPRKAWSYTVYTFVAGVLFGYATVYTGALWASILAHFAINLYGFLEIRALQHKRRSSLRPPISVEFP